MNFEEQRKAYQEDPVFHQLVNVLLNGLEQGQFTVGELRDAATFALSKFQAERVRPILIERKAKGSKTEFPIKLTKSQKRKLKDFYHDQDALEKRLKDAKKIPFDEAAPSKGSTIKEIMAELEAEAVYNDSTRGKKKEEKKE